MSPGRWIAKFDEIIAASPDARKALHRYALSPLFSPMTEGFVKTCLWSYYCLPPQAHTERTIEKALQLKRLSRRLKSLADDLEKASPFLGSSLLGTLDAIEHLVPQKLRTVAVSDLSVIAANQPGLLRTYASVLDVASYVVEQTISDRKLSATRALIWLFLSIRVLFDDAKRSIYENLSLLLDVGNEASGRPERFSTADQVRARITRFEESHTEEFCWIKSYLCKYGLPDQHGFLLLASFEPIVFQQHMIACTER